LYEGNDIQWDLDAITFNPIVSIILKLLSFIFAMVTIASKLFTVSLIGKLGALVLPRTSYKLFNFEEQTLVNFQVKCHNRFVSAFRNIEANNV
jgi:hypothetical protein